MSDDPDDRQGSRPADAAMKAILPKVAKPKRPIGRWALRFFVLPAFGLAMSGLVAYFFDRWRSAEKMAAIVAELDATDPGWRLEEIDAARTELPDDRNSARLCGDLAKRLKHPWPDRAFQAHFVNLRPTELLDGVRLEVLKQEMKRLGPVLTVARPMADMPEGRRRIDWAFDLMDTQLPEQSDARRVAMLFYYESLRRANEGDIDGALRWGRGNLCVARSLSDEPLLMSQLIRVAILHFAWQAFEYALSLGAAGEAELVALENLLRAEGNHNGYLAGALGERASWYIMYSRFADGELPLDLATRPATWRDKADLFSRMQIARNQPLMVEMMNRWVEIARSPPHEQSAAEDALGLDLIEVRRTAPLAVIFMPAVGKVSQSWRRKTAYVAAMRGLIAVERYRMKHGKWPAKLADVVPEYLDKVPTDPFDGKPLRTLRTADGVIVYSVGPDGVDDGGTLDRKNPTNPGVDIGFQLWDVKQRRQPASPPKPEGKP